jgi:hypothetical protein
MDMMCEQLNQGVKGVAETIADYMQLTGFAEGEEAIVNMTIDEAFSKMENQKILINDRQNLSELPKERISKMNFLAVWILRLILLKLTKWSFLKPRTSLRKPMTPLRKTITYYPLIWPIIVRNFGKGIIF